MASSLARTRPARKVWSDRAGCAQRFDPLAVVAEFAKQSAERDQEKRKKIAWEIDRKLTNEAVRPMLYYMRGGTCWRPEVKGLVIQVNSIYNNWRMDEVWLDR